MKYLILLFLVFPITFCLAQRHEGISDSINKKFTIEALKSDLSLLRSELENKHPGLYTYTSKTEMNSAFKKIDSSISEELTAIEFYRKIAVLNSEIKDVHTKIITPEGFRKARDNSLPRLPFAVHIENEMTYVLRNLSNHDQIKPGWQILKINNELVANIVPEMLSRITRDAYNKTGPLNSLETYFSGYYATAKGCPDFFEIEFKDLKNNIKKIKIDALVDMDILANKEKRYSTLEQIIKPISFHISDTIGILRITSFGGGVIKKAGQSYKKEFKKIFKEFRSHQIKKLIIDVRDNRGGWPEVGSELLAYLVPVTFTQGKSDFSLIEKIENKNYYLKDDYLKHFEALKFRKNNTGYDVVWKDEQVKPKKNLFNGSILVLINGASASHTGTFAGILRDKTKALFVGEETGGNPNEVCGGDVLTLILPNSKVMAEIPLRKLITDVEFQNKGHGIIPDYPIEQTLQEKLNREDVVIKFAIEWNGKN